MELRSDHPWDVTLDYHPDIWDDDDGDDDYDEGDHVDDN